MPAMPEFRKAFKALRAHALSHPETREDLPWGESAIKVKGKTFVFMRCEANVLGLSVKLTDHHEFALEYPFTSPTRYGLGKAGWVSCRFEGKARPPLDVLTAWIDESYRNVAPKKLLDRLSAERSATPKESAAKPSRLHAADRGERRGPRPRKPRVRTFRPEGSRKSPRRRRPA